MTDEKKSQEQTQPVNRESYETPRVEKHDKLVEITMLTLPTATITG